MTVFLGNDVVDLTSPHAQGKSSNLRFVNKVLVSQEVKELSLSSDPDVLLWCYWAAKESAYKALSRYEPHISSSPKRYHVVWDKASPSCTRGVVKTPSVTLPVSVFCDETTVLCICFKSDSPVVIYWGAHELPDDGRNSDTVTTPGQSHMVREKTMQSLSSYLNCCQSTLSIQRPLDEQDKAGPPTVFINEKSMPVILSLSHDGRHVFYVWSIKSHHRKRYFPHARCDTAPMSPHDFHGLLTAFQ